MMWDDIGFLLSKSKYNENSIICEVFTKENGKVSGIIFGGTSKKIRNYLQVGNKIYVNYNSKSENKIGYLQTLEEQYGEQYGRVLNELTAEGLPVTAKLVSYFNDENFAILATSIDTKEERTRLDNFLKTKTNLSFKDINESVADELEDFRNSVEKITFLTLDLINVFVHGGVFP